MASNPPVIFLVLGMFHGKVPMFHTAGLPLGGLGAPAGLPLGVTGYRSAVYRGPDVKNPDSLGGTIGVPAGGGGNMYIYPRRAYNPIVGVDFGSVNPPEVVCVNFFGVPGVSRRFYSCFLLTEFIFDPHNGSVDEQRGRENRHTSIEKVSRPHLRPPFYALLCA